MTPQMLVALHATDVLARVRDRLADAWVERGQFDRLSTQELAVLVARETGWGQ